MQYVDRQLGGYGGSYRPATAIHLSSILLPNLPPPVLARPVLAPCLLEDPGIFLVPVITFFWALRSSLQKLRLGHLMSLPSSG